MANDEDCPYLDKLKVVLVGDSGCGKTSLCCRYTGSTFERTRAVTAGVNFYLKRIRLSSDRFITLHLWDVGGGALGGNMLDKYIYGAQVVVFVYDLYSRSSFDNLISWVQAATDATRHQPRAVKPVLIANKSDTSHVRAVDLASHQTFAEEFGMLSFQMSALTGENVVQGFQRMAAAALGARLEPHDVEPEPIVRAQIAQPLHLQLPRPPTATSKRRFDSKLCTLQ